MSTVSASLDEIARHNETTMLQAFSEMTGAYVADVVGVSEATISRFKNEDMPRYAKCLAALGLKCVPVESRQYDEALLEALLTLARLQLSKVEVATDLARFCRT